MQKTIFSGPLAAAALLLALPAAAGTIRNDRSDSLYTALAAQPQFDPVGRFNWFESGGSFLASGTLISDEWVLTAAHVIDGTDFNGGGISNLTFQVGGVARQAEQLISHPNWAATGGENNLFAGWDIGLVRLSQPVTNITPATLNTARDELGEVATIAGFGATGTGLTGATQPGGTKRAGQNIIDAVGPTTTPGSVIAPPTDRLVTIDFDQPGVPGVSTLGSPLPLDLEYLTAPGDSGGGLFIERDGETLLAGVTSLGSSFTQINSDYGDRASFTRVSSFIDWIETNTGLNLTAVLDPADYDGDGLVDRDDYLQWRQDFGSESGVGLRSDGNGDGVVNAADFAFWRNALAGFGSAESGGSSFVVAVPEPTAAALLINLILCGLGFTGGLFRRRR